MSADSILGQFNYILADLRVRFDKEMSEKELVQIAAQLTQAYSLYEVASKVGELSDIAEALKHIDETLYRDGVIIKNSD